MRNKEKMPGRPEGNINYETADSEETAATMSSQEICTKLNNYLVSLINLYNKFTQATTNDDETTAELDDKFDKCVELIDKLDLNQLNDISKADAFGYLIRYFDNFIEFIYKLKKHCIHTFMSLFKKNDILVIQFYKFINKLMNVFYIIPTSNSNSSMTTSAAMTSTAPSGASVIYQDESFNDFTNNHTGCFFRFNNFNINFKSKQIIIGKVLQLLHVLLTSKIKN